MKGYDLMANIKIKNKNQSLKNTLITIGIIIGIIFLVLYIYKWYLVKEAEKYARSYLITTNTISYELKEIDEIDNILSETANYYFIYISYTNDKNIYNFEKDLKPIIDKYNLQNDFYFINITDIKENKNYKSNLAGKLKVSTKDINDIPVILFFKDGKFIKDVYTIKDFKNLLKDEGIDNI